MSVMSAECDMSPKSTMPLIRPASSTRALSVVRSAWMTWARRLGQTGATTRSNRSSVRSTMARWPASRMSGRKARVWAACWTSQSIVRTAAGCMKPRSARPMRAVVSPQPTKAWSDRSRGSLRPRPGRMSYRRTWQVPAGMSRAAPPRAVPVPGAGWPGAAPDPPGRGVHDRLGLHVQGGRVLGRVADLHDRHVRAVAPTSMNARSRSLPRSRARRGLDAEGRRERCPGRPPGSMAGGAAGRTGSMARVIERRW